MKNFLRRARSGFTLVELSIVIAIIAIVMGIGILPYGEYMKRAALNNQIDAIRQEWIIAHKEVRNGILIKESNGTERNASILIKIDEIDHSLKKYLIAGDSVPNLQRSLWVPWKTIALEGGMVFKKIFIRNEDINIRNEDINSVYYFIRAPLGKGKFLKEDGTEFTGATITIGYPDKNMESEIYLAPYLP